MIASFGFLAFCRGHDSTVSDRNAAFKPRQALSADARSPDERACLRRVPIEAQAGEAAGGLVEKRRVAVEEPVCALHQQGEVRARANEPGPYAYWYVKIYGHADVRILDGGRQKWIDEGRALAVEIMPLAPATYTAQERDESIRAFRDQVRSWMGTNGHALVDVRSPREYAGDLIAPPGYEQEGAQRGGHIPTAASIPWATAVRDDGTFRSADELRELYGARGVTPDKHVTAYCRIGERSAHTWFVLRELLGYESVRNYDGSWTEWGNLVDVPIERS
jgi:3-mercaptopyruvate sulfurtransferase SseA